MSLRRPPVPLVECGRCAAPVVWVKLDSGSAIMVNPLPVVDPQRGNVLALLVGVGRGARLHGHIESRHKKTHPKSLRMTPHIATCEAVERAPAQQEDPTLFDTPEE